MRATEFIFEVAMNPTRLKQMSDQVNATAGMEFEMYVPGIGEFGSDSEPDYDEDTTSDSIDYICDFFYQGDMNSRRDIERLRDTLNQEYYEWRSEKISELWSSEGEEFVRKYLEEDEFDVDDKIYDYLKDQLDLSANEIADALEAGKTPYHSSKEQKAAREQDKSLDNYLTASNAVNDELDDLVKDILSNNNRLYDTVFEQFEEEVADNHELSDGTWLSNNYSYMSDISANFDDIQWPFWTSGSDEYALEDVADRFRNAVGRPVETSAEYHGAIRKPNRYVIEPDGSLSEGGLEFVSPPLPLNDMLSDLNKVVSWAKKYGCYTNMDTGLHMNVSVPNYDLDKLDYVKLALLVGDDYVLKQFSREANSYCTSAIKKIHSNMAAKPEDVDAILKQMKTGLDSIATKIIHSGNTDKFVSLNTKTGYVEFRSPGGDWLDSDIPKLENTLRRFVVALDAAMDPQKYRQDYLKKLYALLAPKSNEDPVAYFARYAAGDLPRQALKSFIRNIQQQRDITKKLPQTEPTDQNWQQKELNLQPRQTPREFLGWQLVDANGNELNQIRGIGNNQRDANNFARRWAEDNGYTGEITVLPILR